MTEKYKGSTKVISFVLIISLVIGLVSAFSGISLIENEVYAETETFEAGDFKYEITKEPNGQVPGEVSLIGYSSSVTNEPTSIKIPGEVKNNSNDYVLTEIKSPESDSYGVSLSALDLSSCSSLETIGSLAFLSSEIKSIDFSNCSNLKSIGNNAFLNSSLSDLDLSSCGALQSIGSSAFNKSPIKTINLSGCSELEYIQEYAFFNASLSALDLSSCIKLKDIGRCAFYKSALKTIDLSSCSALESIGLKAFYFSKLNTLDISSCKNLINIGEGSFENSLITDLDFSNCPQLKSIGKQSFLHSPLREINFSNCKKLEVIDSSAFNNSLQSTLDLSDCINLTSIGMYSFNKAQLEELDFSNCKNLQLIDRAAFEYSKLEVLDFSSCTKLNTIGKDAFYNSSPSAVIFNTDSAPLCMNSVFKEGNTTVWIPKAKADNFDTEGLGFLKSPGLTYKEYPIIINEPLTNTPIDTKGKNYNDPSFKPIFSTFGSTLSELDDYYTGKWNWTNPSSPAKTGSYSESVSFTLDKSGLVFATSTVPVIGKTSDDLYKSDSKITVNPKKMKISKITPKKKSLVVKWKKVSGITKYQLRYKQKGKSKWKTITVSAKKSSYTIKKLKKGKKYQVQIRALKKVSGVTYKGAWSKTKTVKSK